MGCAECASFFGDTKEMVSHYIGGSPQAFPDRKRAIGDLPVS
jgi:hypothetical protein